MIGLIARLSRSIPLIAILAILAAIIYFVVTYFRSKARAKEILIAVFIVICSAIIVFFGIVTLYALFEQNDPVFELALSFAGVGVVGLIITLICKHFFKKHNPRYKWKAEKARIDRNKERKRSKRPWPFGSGNPFGPGGPFGGGSDGK